VDRPEARWVFAVKTRAARGNLRLSRPVSMTGTMGFTIEANYRKYQAIVIDSGGFQMIV
jgi:hypothetical protein